MPINNKLEINKISALPMSSTLWLTEKMFVYPLVLASKSPRRSEILKKSGFTFRVLSSEISEILSENMSLDDALMALTRQKAEASISAYENELKNNEIVLAADTIVILGTEVLGKPSNQVQAAEFLRALSGKMHLVKTAYCLWNLKLRQIETEVCTSRVYFRELSEKEISDYVASGEPMDKAGAYGIQGLGRSFVAKFDGTLENIMGLPIQRLEEHLQELGWSLERTSS